MLNKWVSRFDLWPYLERFTIDATKVGRGGCLPDMPGSHGDNSRRAGRHACQSGRAAPSSCGLCHSVACVTACWPASLSPSPLAPQEILAEMGGKPDLIIGNYR